MRKEKVITFYGNIGIHELSTLAGRVLKAMQEPATIAAFPTPNPDLEELEGLVTDYIVKHEISSKGGSTLQNTERDESRDVLLAGLRRLAHYVNEAADGQLSLLLRTG